MQWIKTVENRFINLNFYSELKCYNLEDDQDNFYGIKLTALCHETKSEELISYFKDIEEAEEFVNKFISSPVSLANHFHMEMEDLINGNETDGKFSWNRNGDIFPSWNGDLDAWEEYVEEKELFIKNLNIHENPCYFTNL